MIKAMFLLLFSSLICTTLSTAQIELTNGMKWEYNLSGFLTNDTITSFTIIKDTVINDQQCKVLESEHYNCSERPMLNFLFEQEKKVYYYHEEDSAFHLLYDYNLKSGDTLKLRTWGSLSNNRDYYYFQVDSISEIVFANTNLKKFWMKIGIEEDGEIAFNPNVYCEIIEGIGCTKNLFYIWDTGICDGNYVNEFKCFSHPTFGIYSSANNNCSFLSSVSNKTKEKLDITIIPNPVIDRFDIMTKFNYKEVEIYNSEGVMVFKAQNLKSINTNQLEGGVYILKLTSSNNFKSIRFVKK